MSLADEPGVVARLLDHIDHETTDLSGGVWREPVANYTSPERFEAELRLFRRTTTAFCPSVALPDPGSFIARDAAQVPILAVRGADGKVRAFRNACRHRGAQLAQGAGCKSAFTCPYHAWTYGLDGRLRGVPHEYGFPGLDKDLHSLVPVSCVERHGMVFIAQDGPISESDIDDVPADLLGPEWRLLSAADGGEMPVNWKVVTEGVLEGYHIRATHAETFYPRQYDNLTLVEPFGGRGSRITFPYKAIEKQRPVAESERGTRGGLTHVYHLFPNVSVATFPTHRSLTIFEPVTIDRTRTVSYTLTDRPADEEGQKAVTKGRDFVTDGVREDRDVQIAVQRGIAAGANTHFTFGLFEGGIARLHKHLSEALAS
jgi:phenylpropionate dioxygenase-like ring-hydroxylating dioxygenase large terminal subunit